MSTPTSTPQKVIEDNVVGRISYTLDDEGRTHVHGVPGTGRKVVEALLEAGYDIVLRPGYFVPT